MFIDNSFNSLDTHQNNSSRLKKPKILSNDSSHTDQLAITAAERVLSLNSDRERSLLLTRSAFNPSHLIKQNPNQIAHVYSFTHSKLQSVPFEFDLSVNCDKPIMVVRKMRHRSSIKVSGMIMEDRESRFNLQTLNVIRNTFQHIEIEFLGIIWDTRNCNLLLQWLKRNSKHLKTLVLRINESQLPASMMKKISELTIKLKDLLKFGYDLKGNQFITATSQLSDPLKHLSKLIRLNSLHATIDHLFPLATVSISSISRALPQMKYLQRLNVTAEQISWTQELAREFFENMGKVRYLEELRLHFGASNMEFAGCEDIVNEDCCFQFLKLIDLDFYSCSFIDRYRFKSLANLLKNENLRSIRLNFVACAKFDTVCAEIMAVAVQTAKNPLMFELLLDGCAFENTKWVRTLAETFKSEGWGSMAKLELRMGETIVHDEDLLRLCDALVNMPRLDTLLLKFDKCPNISHRSIKQLGNKLAYQQNLEELTLDFTNCSQINNESMVMIFETLPRFSETLTLLSLELVDIANLQDGKQALEDLAKSLSKLTNLHDFLFNFDGVNKISTPGCVALANALEGLKSLSNLCISLSKTYASDEGLKAIIKACGALMNLKSFKLQANQVFWCSDTTVLSFCALLASKTSLQFAELSAKRGYVSDDCVMNVLNMLRSITRKNLICWLELSNSLILSESQKGFLRNQIVNTELSRTFVVRV